MSLAVAGEQVRALPTGGVRCGLHAVWDTLTTDDRTTLRAWLADPERTARFIVAALDAEGHKVSINMVKRHRPGVLDLCRCGLA